MNGIWTYHPWLPAVDPIHRLSLGEGNTPLIRSQRIGSERGMRHLYFKLESVNPSGSYKDRFAALAVSGLRQRGIGGCLATSSGNTGAALAAYCAAADLPCLLVTVDGAPPDKLRQMQRYGAVTMTIKNFGKDQTVTEQVFRALQELAIEFGTSVQISAYRYAPEGMTGVETIAFEIAQQLDEPNCHVFVPAGGGGLTLAVARGFTKWKDIHPDYSPPGVHCVQPEGNNTIAGALAAGETQAHSVIESTTAISGLQVPSVLDGDEVIARCRRSGGSGQLVSDQQVLDLQERLARQEGIYCEAAGAVALAGAEQAVRQGAVPPDATIICLVTGHGFKDSGIRRAESATHHTYHHLQEALAYINTSFQKQS